MKVRESGMPDKELWESFFDPPAILSRLGLDSSIRDVVEFGCGYGTFTLPAARVVSGTVYAIDIEAEVVKATQAAAEAPGLTNIRAIQRDFVADGTSLAPQTVDYAMLFNILHAERPEIMPAEAFRVIRSGGRLGIIHWNYDSTTPRGPAMDIRPRPQQCQRWAHAAGFLLLEPGLIDLKPYHWGMAFSRPRGRNADEPTGFGSPSAYIPRPRRSQRE